MRGIAPIISTIVVLAVTIIVISIAYLWGSAIIGGLNDKLKIENGKKLMYSLQDTAEAIKSYPAGGKVSVRGYIPDGLVYTDPEKNYIVYETVTSVKTAPFSPVSGSETIKYKGLILLPFEKGDNVYWGGSAAESYYTSQRVFIVANPGIDINNGISVSRGFRKFVFYKNNDGTVGVDIG